MTFHYTFIALGCIAFLNTVAAVQNLWTSGPFVGAVTSTWSRYITPSVVGTVHIIVNEAAGTTMTSTEYHTTFLHNDTETLFTPTSTNKAGYRTYTDQYHPGITLTYPTNFFSVDGNFSWAMIAPATKTGEYNQVNTGNPRLRIGVKVTEIPKAGTCCITTYTERPTSSHHPFTTNTHAFDSADPYGWYYTLAAAGDRAYDPSIAFRPDKVSSMWSPTSIGFNYKGCAFDLCKSTTLPSVDAASSVTGMANILVTTTSTISPLDAPSSTTMSTSSTFSPTPSPSPTPSSSTQPLSTSIAPPPSSSSTKEWKTLVPPTTIPLPTTSSSSSDLPSPSLSTSPSGPQAQIATSSNAALSESPLPAVSSSFSPSPAPSSEPSPSPLPPSSTLPSPSADTPTPMMTLPQASPSTTTMPFSNMTITQMLQPVYMISGQTLAMATPVTLTSDSVTTIIFLSAAGDGQTVLMMSTITTAITAAQPTSTGLGLFIQQGLGG